MGYRQKSKGAAVPGFQDLVDQDLKTGNFRPVYLLAGEDTLRIEGVVEKIRKDALGESGSAFNFHVFQGDQTPVEKILQQALSLPMLGKLQVIWVKQAGIGSAMCIFHRIYTIKNVNGLSVPNNFICG